MGFQKIEKRSFGHRTASTVPVTMSLATSGNGHRARLSFSEATAKSLNLKHGERIEISIGSDRDAGWLRVRKADEGYTLRSSRKDGGGRLFAEFAAVDAWPLQVASAEPRALKPQSDGALHIQVPLTWLPQAAAA